MHIKPISEKFGSTVEASPGETVFEVDPGDGP